MDGKRFDFWAKKVATGPTRRRVMAGLAGGALAALGLGLGDRSVEAARTPRPPRRPGRSNVCPLVCNEQEVETPHCGGEKDFCFCAATTAHKSACYDAYYGHCGQPECHSDSDCDPDSACIASSLCCDGKNVCVPLCGTRKPPI